MGNSHRKYNPNYYSGYSGYEAGGFGRRHKSLQFILVNDYNIKI